MRVMVLHSICINICILIQIIYKHLHIIDSRCTPIHLHSNHIYNDSNLSNHINMSCPTIVMADNKNNSDHHDDADKNNFILRRPSPLFLDSIITL